jgi:hypothetical protein
MKKFALYLPNTEQPKIVEGLSAVVLKESGGLKVTITTAPKKKQTFNGVVIFCELSEQIKVV